MGLNLAEIQQKLDRLIQNIAEQNRRTYQIFYDPNPQDVTLPQLDENGNLVNVTIPNRAKILADFEAWKKGAQEEFVGTQLISSNWSSTAGVSYAYGNTGDISITTECTLKHDTNPNSDGTPTQSDLYDAGGNHLLTLPLHPAAGYKSAVFPTIKVHIENQDSSRHFYIQVPMTNKNPRTKCAKGFSRGVCWLYFSRDVDIQIVDMLSPEYSSGLLVHIDGELLANNSGSIKAGWHYIEAQNIGYSQVCWNTLEIIRFKFLESDSLSPVDILVTHPSILANVYLSAIVEKA